MYFAQFIKHFLFQNLRYGLKMGVSEYLQLLLLKLVHIFDLLDIPPSQHIFEHLVWILAVLDVGRDHRIGGICTAHMF